MRHAPSTVYRRRRIVVGTAALVALAVIGYFPVTLLTPLESASAVVANVAPVQVDAPQLAWPDNRATAIARVDEPGILAAQGTLAPHAIASITKVITALVVLDAHPLGDGTGPGERITLTQRDRDLYDSYLSAGGLVQPVTVGESFSQREMLEITLISSSNNYAHTLAVWAFGSEKAFLEATRAWLEKQGLHETTIMEPTGMDPRNTSTVPDLLQLGRLVVADPVISGIVALPTVHIGTLGDVENSNKLLGQFGVTGIKTGTLDAAGACLLFSAELVIGSRTVSIVGVALGGKSHKIQYPQLADFLRSVTSHFSEMTLTTAGQPFADYTTMWGEHTQAVADETVTALVWGSAAAQAEVTTRPVSVLHAGADVGEVRYTVGDTQFTVPLVLSSPLRDPGPWWRLARPFAS